MLLRTGPQNPRIPLLSIVTGAILQREREREREREVNEMKNRTLSALSHGGLSQGGLGGIGL